MLDSAFDGWTVRHVAWGMVYALAHLRPRWVYGLALAWEAYEAVVRQVAPDDAIFAPESWSNIAVDVAAALAAYHALRWGLIQAVPRIWGPMQPRAPVRGTAGDEAKSPQAPEGPRHTP